MGGEADGVFLEEDVDAVDAAVCGLKSTDRRDEGFLLTTPIVRVWDTFSEHLAYIWAPFIASSAQS